ncbi:unnamed protein product [Brassica napus]|uniref:Fatty acyl-CoA reductase n=1 Tax=Brassica napus TaxID=3708 RepID=A0A816JJD3_BRANA|nr:unnamed protein product [Brassica napus]
MATTNLIATSNAVRFFSSFSGKPNYFLSRRLLPTTHRGRSDTSLFYREMSLKAVKPVVMPETSDGIGIVRFLRGKSYFVTGATGFLGKETFLLVQKLLRASPEIGKIFILLKSKDEESANKRLYDEIISSDLFKLQKQMHGSSYEAFMKSKLIPVIGDIGEENLGIDVETADKISDEIDVKINSAGRTTLTTAFVTGKEGTVLETPLCIGKNITSELKIENEVKLASEAARKFHGACGRVARDEFVGPKGRGFDPPSQICPSVWPSNWVSNSHSNKWAASRRVAYRFTKAMGESLLHSNRGDLPVVIIRPSVIESSYKEPFPGWLQGIIKIPDLLGDYQSSCDVIPVDMVANAIIAVMAKHGCGNVPEVKVYNVTSTSHAHPLRMGEIMDFSYQHLCDSPLTETTTKVFELMKFHSSLEEFTSSVSKAIRKQERAMKNGEEETESHTTLSMKGKRKLKYFVSLAKTYQPYMFFQGRFDESNTRSLIHELSMEERQMFDFDGSCIDWEHYFINIHLPSLKRELFRQRSS